jgi:hypothetical protein
MNWTWNIRSRDGAMNGLEFARCTTAGGFTRVLIHAAPGHATVDIITDDDRVVARGDLDRHGEYSPMTLIELKGSTLSADARRSGWVDSSVRLGGHEISGSVGVRSPGHA